MAVCRLQEVAEQRWILVIPFIWPCSAMTNDFNFPLFWLQ